MMKKERNQLFEQLELKIHCYIYYFICLKKDKIKTLNVKNVVIYDFS